MADNVVLNAGAGGATLATDEIPISLKHYQKVKLADGAADSEAMIGGDATNGLDVDVTRVSGTVTTDPSDRALRDCGKVDVAGLDQYTPQDTDVGAGTLNALPVVLKAVVSGGGDLGASATPMRVDPVGSTPQPITATSLPLPTGAAQEHTTAGSPHGARLSDGTAFYDAAKTGQLPVALVGGRLDVVVGAALPAGTNNVGDVDVVTLPALPAGTNNIGDVDVLTLPSVTKTLKRAVGNAASSGDNTLIAAPGVSKVIKIISYALQGTGTVNAKMTDGAAGTQLTALWNFQAREGVYAQPTVVPQYHMKCTANTALVLNLSAAVGVGFEITYWDDDAA